MKLLHLAFVRRLSSFQNDFLIYTENYSLFCKMPLRLPVKLLQYRGKLHVLRGSLPCLCVPVQTHVENSYAFSLFLFSLAWVLECLFLLSCLSSKARKVVCSWVVGEVNRIWEEMERGNMGRNTL